MTRDTRHDWFTDVLEVDEDSMYSPYLNALPTFWGYMLFEGEYLEVMTICMICGHSVHGCSCE